MIHPGAGIGAAILAIALVAACKDEPVAIAVLVETSVGTDKQVGTGPWGAAPAGARFFRGDAVRTADHQALLSLGPTARLRVEPRSLIRFGEDRGASSLAVELGEANLEGTGGTYQLGLGAVTLDGEAAIRLTPGDRAGQTRVELVLGAATLEDGGDRVAMTAGAAYVLGLGAATLEPRRVDAALAVADAAVADAAVADAAASTADDTVALVVTGRKASSKAEGGAAWLDLPAGAGSLAAGAQLKVGRATSVLATHPGVTLELTAGSRLTAGGVPFVAVTAGQVRASGEDGARGVIKLPGGQLILDGARSGATVEIGRRKSEIAVTRGVIELVGRTGRVALQQGETAVLGSDGAVRIMNAVPKHFDLQVSAGDSFTVHDPNPRPGTAVRFNFDCGGDGTVEIGKDGFRAPRVSGGTGSANLMVAPGQWRYRVRCGTGKLLATGRIAVRRDSGTRSLPKGEPPTNFVDADGFTYKVYYQNLKPVVQFRWKKATGTGLFLHLTRGKDRKALAATGGSVTVPGSELEDGVHQFYFANAAGAKSPTSSLVINFDNAAPSAYIEEPKDKTPWAGQVTIKGATLPGYTASVDGVAMALDGSQRFEARIAPPSANAIAIKLAHARHGVHYYLRRQR